MKVRVAQLVAYDQAEGHTGTKVAVLVEGDVYIHSYALGPGIPVRTSWFRIVNPSRGWKVALVQVAAMLTPLKNHAGFLERLWGLSHCVRVGVGGVGQVVVERAVFVVMKRVVVGMRYVQSSKFEVLTALVTASMAIDDETAVRKQRLVSGRGLALHQHC